jgi:SsrA-binding protein
LHRSEISNIKEDIQQKGGTAVPLRLYWLRGKVKLEIGVAFGKKQADKRQDIKERDWKREKDRELKQKNR